MLMKINPVNDVPIYLQIRQEIINGIVSGELSPGDQLPSVRQLATDIGINMHTVNKAYALLRSEGYVLMQGRKGAIISEIPDADEEYFEDIMTRLRSIVTEAKARGLSEKKLFEISEKIINETNSSNQAEEKGGTK